MTAPATASPTIRTRITIASPWAVAVWAAAGLYAVLLSVESIYDHDSFWSGFDVAIYDQRLWLLANWHDPFSTVVSRPFLADHFEPGLVLLTPLYWLGLGVPGMLTAQSIGLALTAPALFALGRASGASPALASIPAFLWLASPAVATANLFDFRPLTFAPVLLVLSVLAVVRDRPVLLAVTAVLALSLKEEMALIYVMLGLLLVYHGRRRLGAILAMGSAACFVVGLAIIRSLGDSDKWFGRRFAGDRGDTFAEAFVYMVRHPLDTVTDALGHSGFDLLVLVLSTSGLAFLAPAWILLSAPTILHNALSAYEPQHDLIHHYHVPVLTAVFIAAAIGAGRLNSLGLLGRRLVAVGIAVAVASALVGGVRQHSLSGRPSGDERAAIRRALDRIPPDVPVAAAPVLLPHLSHRVELYSLPEPFVRLDWGSPLTSEEYAERAARVRFVALAGGMQPTEFEGEIEDVHAQLLKQGFVEVANSRAGYIVILERRNPSD